MEESTGPAGRRRMAFYVLAAASATLLLASETGPVATLPILGSLVILAVIHAAFGPGRGRKAPSWVALLAGFCGVSVGFFGAAWLQAGMPVALAGALAAAGATAWVIWLVGAPRPKPTAGRRASRPGQAAKPAILKPPAPGRRGDAGGCAAFAVLAGAAAVLLLAEYGSVTASPASWGLVALAPVVIALYRGYDIPRPLAVAIAVGCGVPAAAAIWASASSLMTVLAGALVLAADTVVVRMMLSGRRA